jgi:hypothetical protein
VLGSEKADPRFGLPALMDIYSGAIARISRSRYQVTATEPVVQAAFVADLECVLDRFVVQLVTYGSLVDSGIDPAWMAVTGYYAAFFAASALLVCIGVCNRRVPALGALPPATYHITATTIGVGTVRLELRSTPASHAIVWNAVATLIGRLQTVPGLDARSAAVLGSLLDTVIHPTLLSDVRNDINYSIDEPVYVRAPWACEVKPLNSADALEDRLLRRGRIREEARIELACLGCGSLAAALYADYLARPGKRDRRRAERRRALLDGHAVEWIRPLGGWLA